MDGYSARSGYRARLKPAEDTEWQDYAACGGMSSDLFFTAGTYAIDGRNGSAEDELAGKAICLSCPVKQECLEYALKIKAQHGIWGGMSTRERRKLAKQRRLDAEH